MKCSECADDELRRNDPRRQISGETGDGLPIPAGGAPPGLLVLAAVPGEDEDAVAGDAAAEKETVHILGQFDRCALRPGFPVVGPEKLAVWTAGDKSA